MIEHINEAIRAIADKVNRPDESNITGLHPSSIRLYKIS